MEAFPLTSEDQAILALESATVVGHTCKIIRAGPGAPGLAALRARVAERVSTTPALTRRLAETSAGPAWVPDGRFDVTAHVVQVPGAPREPVAVRSVVADLFAERLDRERPLWRIDLIPVHGGGAVLVWRVHHALADGTTLMRYAHDLLWDAIPQAGPQPGPQPGPQAAGPAHHHARSPADDDVRRRGHLVGFLTREFARTHDRSPFDGRIGTRREVAFASTGLDRLHHAAKDVSGATLNDAVLTSVAGGLRRWVHEHHGHLGVVRVKVPVSLHHESDDAANRDSFFTVSLPLNEPDPVARLRQTQAATSVRKADEDAQTMDTLVRHLGDISPPLARLCERIEQSPRSFAVNVSNVPGPRLPVTLLSAPVDAMYALAEIGERHALRVAVVSLGDTLSFGICADPAIVEHVQTIADGIEAESQELCAAATEFSAR
ncbi:MAG: WS/DGAT domain-containing protein [Nocardioidaceae bacterium]